MRTLMLSLGLALGAASLTLPSWGGNATSVKTSKTSKNHPNAKTKAPQHPGPAETRAERDKRLQRECKGRPNAGACEGYGG